VLSLHLGSKIIFLLLLVAGILMRGALSDRRTGLSSTIATGTHQRSHSRVRITWVLGLSHVGLGSESCGSRARITSISGPNQEGRGSESLGSLFRIMWVSGPNQVGRGSESGRSRGLITWVSGPSHVGLVTIFVSVSGRL
jgi:hypothetical protein